MTSNYETRHATLLQSVLAALPNATGALERRFTEQLFVGLPVADLEQLDVARAVAVAGSMFEFFRVRDVARPALRILASENGKYGYHATSLVIECINDDMPFLVDSLTMELGRQGLRIRDTYHPMFHVSRDAKGALLSLGATQDSRVESLIHFEVSALPEGMTAAMLEDEMMRVLGYVRAAVADWKAILQKTQDHIAQLQQLPAGFDAAYVAEVRDFIAWLAAKNFVFLGYGEYAFLPGADAAAIDIVGSAKLGILSASGDDHQMGLETMPQDQRHRLLARQLIEITKSNRRSPVHRRVPMDYIAIKRFDALGNVVGEARFLGLFTSNVYYQSAGAIPLLRTKLAHVLARSGFVPTSHDGKAFSAILEFLPRDEVFQMTEEDLFELGMGILSLEAKPGVRSFVRKDVFERFVSVMVFVPREQFSTELRQQIQRLLEVAYNGTSTAFTTQITDAPLARLHLIIRTTPGDVPYVEIPKLDREIARLAGVWSDQLLDALLRVCEEPVAMTLHKRYARAFPPAYISRYDTHSACHDIGKAEAALAAGILELELYQLREEDGFAHLKIYHPNQEIALSDMVPLLENAGFRVMEEHPYLINPQDTETRIWIRDFKLQLPSGLAEFGARKEQVESALRASWQGEIEADRLNALVLLAGCSYREVTILRAVAKYLKQTGWGVTQTAVEQCLCAHPSIAQQMVALFDARFRLELLQRDVHVHRIKTAIEDALERVTSASEDRILRSMTQTILAMLRTNYYQEARPILSFKLRSSEVPHLPLPVPFAEIFVYSPRVEGIHLRGGKVARGGLRWSDRVDDFRTEVLGLMKAQMVKNAVIVPVGSKGGFVLKQPPVGADRDALQKEGVACYQLYLQGLLDLTDNLQGEQVVPPSCVVRHDGDDPYLVVAADKGTATFSDIANQLSRSYGFWLGDAFASGGSAGYDHKKMGITARGGWISVTRHFAEMGRDIAQQEFTCVGIGDMAGDVFGNGMLLSRHTRLVAAFNHQHIFMDPNPDAARSFTERERLFRLPRSSWKDYDPTLLSPGGGVYERSAKRITLSPEAVAALALPKREWAPDELIRALLMASVDLLWNGGIGTYVKAEDESHEQVGDRANNSLRVNGKDLRCLVVGEGGNLGFTQKGRIEYARLGGRINTDAIDNSAGVDCSDHEVNIKIAFSALLRNGTLTLETRDLLLQEMTEEVGELVLKDNRLQTLALSVALQKGGAALEGQVRLMHALEAKGLLTRAVEYLPSDQQLSELKQKSLGLTRPELAVLLAYSKMDLYEALLADPILSDPYFEHELQRYFPAAMQHAYSAALSAHPLRREIIATMLTNSLVNRMGCTFVNDLVEQYHAAPADIAVGYALIRDAFSLREHWKQLDALTGVLPLAQQVEMFVQLAQFIRARVEWLLLHMSQPFSIPALLAEVITPAQRRIAAHVMTPQEHACAQAWMEQGVPASLAAFVAQMEQQSHAFDIVFLAGKHGLPESSVEAIYHALRQ